MKFKRYPNYKDSGVEWIAEIPEHWQSLRFKSLFELIYRYPTYYNIEYISEGVPEIRGEALRSDGTINKLEDERYISNETNARYPLTQLKNGDLVMSVRGTMGKVGLVDYRYEGANITANLIRLSPKDGVLGEFLCWFFLSQYFRQKLESISPQTTIKTITVPQLSQIQTVLPHVEEQHDIAFFLNRETAKIDALIEKKERLIELLKEKRTALISHAVTKGLDPNVTMKDSGVEWLGEIPSHWDVKRVKRLFRVFNGSTPKSGQSVFWDGDIPWVTPDDLGALEKTEIFETQRYITEAGYRSCGTTLVPKGSLVLSTRAPIGHLAIAGVDLCTNQGCRCLVFLGNSYQKYFYYQILAARSELESWGQGSTFKELGKSHLEFVHLTDPPYPKRVDITTYLDRETAKIDALINKTRGTVEKLKEYRTALISAAVTGKIDVREEAA